MFSVVEQAGVQFKIAEGDTINVPLMKAEPGSEVTLDKVLMVGTGADVRVGAPTVEGAVVKATVVKHFKGTKVVIMKKHRRKDYKRKNGNRQSYTQLKISAIAA